MSVGWVAGAIRGKALARRGLGREATRRVASERSLPEALRVLGDSTYGHWLKADMDLESAQRAVSETALWHLRVLAGWLPPSGVEVARAFAAWFEGTDLAALAVAISTRGSRRAAPFALGALGMVQARAANAESLERLRAVLAYSEWGDPGGDSLADILLGLRLGWARVLSRTFRERPEWAGGELALSAATALLLAPSDSASVDARRIPELSSHWTDVREVGALAARMPDHARWVLSGIEGPDALWQAELAWWIRLEADGEALLETGALGRATVVGAAATLLADSWRVRAALANAYRGGAQSDGQN